MLLPVPEPDEDDDDVGPEVEGPVDPVLPEEPTAVERFPELAEETIPGVPLVDTAAVLDPEELEALCAGLGHPQLTKPVMQQPNPRSRHLMEPSRSRRSQQGTTGVFDAGRDSWRSC